MRYTKDNQAVITDNEIVPFWAINSQDKYQHIKLAHENGEILPYKTELELEKEKFDNAVQEETLWRDNELYKTLNRIDQYEKDQHYHEQYRTSPISSQDDYFRLLNDRKLLSDYPDIDGFPFTQRPQLSGLA